MESPVSDQEILEQLDTEYRDCADQPDVPWHKAVIAMCTPNTASTQLTVGASLIPGAPHTYHINQETKGEAYTDTFGGIYSANHIGDDWKITVIKNPDIDIRRLPATANVLSHELKAHIRTLVSDKQYTIIRRGPDFNSQSCVAVATKNGFIELYGKRGRIEQLQAKEHPLSDEEIHVHDIIFMAKPSGPPILFGHYKTCARGESNTSSNIIMLYKPDNHRSTHRFISTDSCTDLQMVHDQGTNRMSLITVSEHETKEHLFCSTDDITDVKTRSLKIHVSLNRDDTARKIELPCSWLRHFPELYTNIIQLWRTQRDDSALILPAMFDISEAQKQKMYTLLLGLSHPHNPNSTLIPIFPKPLDYLLLNVQELHSMIGIVHLIPHFQADIKGTGINQWTNMKDYWMGLLDETKKDDVTFAGSVENKKFWLTAGGAIQYADDEIDTKLRLTPAYQYDSTLKAPKLFPSIGMIENNGLIAIPYSHYNKKRKNHNIVISEISDQSPKPVKHVTFQSDIDGTLEHCSLFADCEKQHALLWREHLSKQTVDGVTTPLWHQCFDYIHFNETSPHRVLHNKLTADSSWITRPFLSKEGLPAIHVRPTGYFGWFKYLIWPRIKIFDIYEDNLMIKEEKQILDFNIKNIKQRCKDLYVNLWSKATTI